MDSNRFAPNAFFEFSQFAHKDIFAQSKYVWEAIGKLDSYLEKLFSAQLIKPNYKNSPNIYIGEGVVINEGALIEGPAVIGAGSQIGHGAYLRGGCLLGVGVRIGHAVEAKHSIFLDRATVAHLNYIGDSIVGADVNISGGAICANFRLDKKPVVVKDGDKYLETGLLKLGAVIGDGSNIGVNAVLNPGALLAPQSVVYPLTSVSGMKSGLIKNA